MVEVHVVRQLHGFGPCERWSDYTRAVGELVRMHIVARTGSPASQPFSPLDFKRTYTAATVFDELSEQNSIGAEIA